jgi:hypothetical protein
MHGDSCYLCEIGKEGLFVPLNGHTVLICQRCVLDCIYRHPRLVALSGKKEFAA